MRSRVPVGPSAWVSVMLGVAACQSGPTEPEKVTRLEESQVPGPPAPISRIAFAGRSGGSTAQQVFTVKRAGGGLAQLTTFPVGALVSEPRWSPAGPSRIAFFMKEDPDSGDAHLYVMESTGAGLVALAPVNLYFSDNIAWSPDGTRLAFIDAIPVVADADTVRLRVVNADGSGLVQLAKDPSELNGPAWSPDGQRVMYYTFTDHPRTLTNERGVWTIKSDGTGKTKVLKIPAASWTTKFFQYSPDGTKVVLCNDYDVKVMNANGTGLVNLGLDCNGYVGPQWSPNGARILTTKWLGAANGGRQLFTVKPDGSDQVQVTFADGPSFSGVWSRGGGWIAFVRQRDNGKWDLNVTSATGSQASQVTSGIHVGRIHSWGP